MKKIYIKVAAIVLAIVAVSPLQAHAAQLADRSVTLGSSGAAANTTYTIGFKAGTTGPVGSVKFQICDTPVQLGACNQAAGAVNASFATPGAALVTGAPTSTEFSTFAAGTGGQAATASTFWITDSGTPSLTSGSDYVVRLSNVHNPSVVNSQFYVRIYTYADAAGTSLVDYGAVAASTAEQITVTGTMPESLVFCVGTSGTNCGNMTGTTVDLGTFSPTATNSGVSIMSASTNADSGYAITVNGTTLESGANSIAALATQTAAATGGPQYGLNLRDNATPNVGSTVTGGGSATVHANYNTVDQYRFVSGDTVASATGPTADNLFTAAYIVNVPGSQAAGTYTATMTYIATATF